MAMTFDEAKAGAARTRELYRQLEQRRYGREWDARDLFIGFLGDVGDLAQLLGAQQGVRPGPENLEAAIAHELADCLWSLLVIADELEVDLETAFAALLGELTDRVTRKLAE
jgi:NTP pyrophosphatase (non-canonical NTP hydrolase)